MLTRVICKDGLVYVGTVDDRRSNAYKLYLLGHTHYIWKSNISDMFDWTGFLWIRVHGHPSCYDEYIARGGLLWPREFFDILMSNDI